MSQGETVFERNPDFIYRRVVDESILVPIRQDVADMDCIFALNDLGAFIWERLDGRATLSDLRAAVASEYEGDPAAIAADLLEFVQGLESAGAVRRV